MYAGHGSLSGGNLHQQEQRAYSIRQGKEIEKGTKEKRTEQPSCPLPPNLRYSPFRFANIFSYILSALLTLAGKPTSTIFSCEAPDRFGAGALWKVYGDEESGRRRKRAARMRRVRKMV